MYHIRIEKDETAISFYLNDLFQFSCINYLPESNPYVGILAKDKDQSIEDFFIFLGEKNFKIDPLAHPNALLEHKEYESAIKEYRQVSQIFQGTVEGREALFRAGIALNEQGKNRDALKEFSQLSEVSGGPLEYLGRALVSQSSLEWEDEAISLEQGFEHFPHHPLLPKLHRHLADRIQGDSNYWLNNRRAMYYFALLTLKYLPPHWIGPNFSTNFSCLQMHWEPLYFIHDVKAPNNPELYLEAASIIRLAFWLAKPDTLIKMIDTFHNSSPPHLFQITNALFALIELGSWKYAEQKINEIFQLLLDVQAVANFNWIQEAIFVHHHKEACLSPAFLSELPQKLEISNMRTILYIFREAIQRQQTYCIYEGVEQLMKRVLSPDHQSQLDYYRIWAYLLDKNWTAAGELLHQHPEKLTTEISPFHFLYGCWICATKGKNAAQHHFSTIPNELYPRSWNLFSYFSSHKSKMQRNWLPQAFLWEKRRLYQQCALFYHCANDEKKVQQYRTLEKQEYSPQD